MSVYNKLIESEAQFNELRKNRLELTRSIGNNLLSELYSKWVGDNNFDIPITNPGPLYKFSYEGTDYEIKMIFVKDRGVADEYVEIQKFVGTPIYSDLYNAVNELEGHFLMNVKHAYYSLDDVRRDNNTRLAQIQKSDKRRFVYYYIVPDGKKMAVGFFAARNTF